MNLWAPKPKCHTSWTHFGVQDEKKTPVLSFWLLWSCGEAAKPWQAAAAEALVLPCLFLSSLILLCSVTCAPLFFVFCYSVLPNTPMSRHLSHHCRSNICFRYEFWNYFHVPEFVHIFDFTQTRHITDYPWETGACLIRLYPLGDCLRPSTVPLAPGRLSNDVIGEE